MATPVSRGPIRQGQDNTSVAAGNALTLAVTAPGTHEKLVIDSITIGYVGTTQTSLAWNIQDHGGGTVYAINYVVGPAAGVASQHFDYPSGFKIPTAGQAVDITTASLANCAIRASCTWHVEGV